MTYQPLTYRDLNRVQSKLIVQVPEIDGTLTPWVSKSNTQEAGKKLIYTANAHIDEVNRCLHYEQLWLDVVDRAGKEYFTKINTFTGRKIWLNHKPIEPKVGVGSLYMLAKATYQAYIDPTKIQCFPSFYDLFALQKQEMEVLFDFIRTVGHPDENLLNCKNLNRILTERTISE